MKKVICGIALVLTLAIVSSCGNQKKNAVVAGETVEVVDSTAVQVAVDSLQVAE